MIAKLPNSDSLGQSEFFILFQLENFMAKYINCFTLNDVIVLHSHGDVGKIFNLNKILLAIFRQYSFSDKISEDSQS